MSDHAPGDQPPSPPRIPDHELLKCIGEGSYGQVWLSRNVVLDQWRAVKVVFNSKSVGDENDWKRELNGIRQYEPISRNHDSLVKILHVGQDEAAGFFYYVMELADSVQGSGIPNPASYEPRTLRGELKRRGRLPPAECIEIGIALAIGLEQLHQNDLVHRDIKPANIVFAQGKPKLADIGLVTNRDATMSYVGTEGYVPLEGPGKPADIYALGKVLYEIATGQSRLDFPKLPPLGGVAESEKEVLRELNAVFLKACHKNPDQRHRDAGALRKELMGLQAGRSIVRARVAEGAWRRVKAVWSWAAALIALVLLLVRPWELIEPTVEFKSLSARPKPAVPSSRVEGQWNITEFGLDGIGRWHAAHFGEFNKEAPKELFVWQDNKCHIVDLKGTVNEVFEMRPTLPADLEMVADFDTNRLDEMFVRWSSRRFAYLGILNQRELELARFRTKGKFQLTRFFGASYTVLHPRKLIDLDNDGRVDILATVESTWALKPRGLACFDAQTFRQRWFFRSAPLITEIVTLRLGDGRGDLCVAGSSSVSNGAKLSNGTDDGHCYVFAVSGEKGNSLWKQEVGTNFVRSHPFLVQSRSNESPRLFAWVEANREYRGATNEVGRIIELNPTNGSIIASYDAQAQLLSCVVDDWRGTPELLATDRKGFLHVLGLNLKETTNTQVVALSLTGTNDEVRLFIDAVTNVVGKTGKQLVLHSSELEVIEGHNRGNEKTTINIRKQHRNTIHLLDSTLKRIGAHQVAKVWTSPGDDPGWSVRVADSDVDGVTDIISLSDKVTILQFRSESK